MVRSHDHTTDQSYYLQNTISLFYSSLRLNATCDSRHEEISLEEFQQECDEDEVAENDLAAVEDNSEVVDATTVQSNNDQSSSTSVPK